MEYSVSLESDTLIIDIDNFIFKINLYDEDNDVYVETGGIVYEFMILLDFMKKGHSEILHHYKVIPCYEHFWEIDLTMDKFIMSSYKQSQNQIFSASYKKQVSLIEMIPVIQKIIKELKHYYEHLGFKYDEFYDGPEELD